MSSCPIRRKSRSQSSLPSAWYGAQRSTGAVLLTKEAGISTHRRTWTNAATKAPLLAKLAKNPMLLTTMAIVHQERGTRLPDERVEALPSKAVDILLRKWQEEPGRATSGSFLNF